MKERIKEIIHSNYKNASCGYVGVSSDGDYATLIVLHLHTRFMPYAAKRILEEFPTVRYVHFTGGWTEHVYSRETLRWMGINVKKAA